MTAVLFDRVWGVEVTPASGRGQLWSDFRLRCTARQGGSSPGATVEVSNPTEAMVGLIRAKGSVVRVLAGYRGAGGASEIIQGRVLPKSVEWNRKPPTTRAAFELSGSRGPILTATLAKVVRGPVMASEVIEALRVELGLADGGITVGEDLEYKRRYILEGSASVALDALASETGSRWAITSGRLRVWPANGAVKRLADVWEDSTGLLDVVGPASDGLVHASALLRPAARVGDAIEVRSATWTGQIAAREVGHRLDSHGNTWRTDVIGRPL